MTFDDPAKSTNTTIKQSQTVAVKQAAEQIVPQKLSPDTTLSLQQVAQNTNQNNANSLDTAFDSAVDKPVNSFSAATNKIAAVFIPPAEAAEPSDDASYTPTASYTGSSRQPASESVLNSPALTPVSGVAGNGEKLVEQIIVPTPDGSSYTSSTVVTPAVNSTQLIGSESSKTPQFRADVNAATPSAGSGLGSGPSGGVNLGSASSPSSSRGPASVGSSNSGGGGGFSGGSAPNIGGITFTQSNVTGSGYQKYQAQISNPSFVNSLESSGILISKDGSLLSKPKNVSSTYIDTGSALIYGGL